MPIHSLQQKTFKKDFLSLAKVMPFQYGKFLNNSLRKCEKKVSICIIGVNVFRSLNLL